MLHRIGTAVGVYLASAEIFSTAQIDVLSNAVTILSGVALDLLVRKVL